MEFSLFLFTLQWIIFFHTMYAMMLGKYFFLSIHNSSCYYIFGMLWMNLGFFSKWCWSSFLEVKKYFHILLSRSELDRKYFWHVVRVVGRLFFLIFHSFGFATTGTSKALPTVWQSTWYFQIGCSHSYGTARYINFIFAWKLAYTWVICSNCRYVIGFLSVFLYPFLQTINSITNGLFWRTQTTSQEVPKDT